MSAGAFKRSSRGRVAVPSWTRGYRGRFVTRRDWLGIAAGWAWGLGSVAFPLWLVWLMETGAHRV